MLPDRKKERKSYEFIIKKYGAIGLCLVIGFLATQSATVQDNVFGRTVIGGPMVALLVSMIACNMISSLDKDFKAQIQGWICAFFNTSKNFSPYFAYFISPTPETCSISLRVCGLRIHICTSVLSEKTM